MLYEQVYDIRDKGILMKYMLKTSNLTKYKLSQKYKK
jgi:hypothetical protein